MAVQADPAVTAVTSLAPVAGNVQELRARQELLLKRTMRVPSDYDATYEYVAVSIQLRDNEAAIGALERLINYDPGLSRANYELGLLYFQLGSYDAAVHFLRSAASVRTAEPSVRARIEALYSDASKQQQQSRWFGTIQTGLRHQSNANFIPSGSAVRLNGQDLFLNPSTQRRADGSAFGLVQVGNDYDLQNQRGDVLETRLSGFGSKQFRATEYDFGYVEASFGPRFGLPEIGSGASIKPYVVGQTSFLRGERSPYISSGGGGVTVRLPAVTGVTFEPGVEARRISVRNSDPLFVSTLNDSAAVSGYLLSSAKITDNLDFETRVIGIRADANQSWQSFGRIAWSVAANVQFDPLSSLIPRKWKFSPFVGGAVGNFDGPNPAIDPLIKRRDTEFKAGAVLDAPLTSVFGLSAAVYFDRINSNLSNYRQRDLTVLGGPVARF